MGELRNIIVFSSLITFPAWGAETATAVLDVCRRTSQTVAEVADYNLKFSEPARVLRDEAKPFHGTLLSDYGRLLNKRFDRYGLQANELSPLMRADALALMRGPAVLSRSNADGHQFRFDPVSERLAIVNKEGEIVFFWQLEPGKMFHGYNEHRTFFDVISNPKSNRLRSGAGISNVEAFTPTSLAEHHGKHGREFGARVTAEQYARKAELFAQRVDPRALTISFTENGEAYQIKFNPVTNETAILVQNKRSGNWRLRTYYMMNPQFHQHKTNMENFLTYIK